MAEGRLAVVGAGLAGLAAAAELKRRGHTVELFERSRLVGGKATSFEVDGIEVDNGQHVFLACCREFIDFLSQIGMEAGENTKRSEIVYLQPHFQAVLLAAGSPPITLTTGNLPPPLHLLPLLFESRHLGLSGRLRVALAVLALDRGAGSSQPFSDWLQRHRQNRRTVVGFWEPFVVPALNAELSEVSTADAAFVIRTAFLNDVEGARLGYSRVPLAHIAKMAVQRIDAVHLRAPVSEVRAENGHVTLRVKDGAPQRFDGVVLAMPPERLKVVLGSAKSFGVFGLDQFKHAPIVDVHLWYDMTPGTLFSGIDFAALLDSPIQWVFEKPAPTGETYLCCSMSAARQHIGLSRESLAALAHRELVDRLPRLKEAKLLRSAATRDREATFVPSIGLVRPDQRTAFPRVSLAGAWTKTGWPATMESAVRSGRKAAEVIDGAIAA